MASNLQDLGSNSALQNKAGQPAFNANKIAEKMIERINEQDQDGRNMRDQLKSQCESYKENVQFANNNFGNDKKIKEIIYRAKKSFFNHKYNTQELLRSQHLYKLVHELKYTPEKNIKSYPDVLEDGYKEVLKVNDKDYEIRDALLKWYEHRYNMITFVQKELQRQYFQLFACELDEYSENSKNIALQMKQSEEALLEVEDVIRNLKSERFFRNSKHYERKHLPELSVVSAGNVIIEQTYAKALKNFPYITEQHIKLFFNDYVNQHYCTRKVKKIRLINDYLPYKIQFLNTIKTAKQVQMQSKINFNNEQDEFQRELNKLYGVRQAYILASDKAMIERNVAEFSKQLGIKEDINIDYGCLLLFAIDKKFEAVIKEQSETFLQFYSYDLKSPFMTMTNQKKFGDQATELMKTIESENRGKDNIKIRSCKTWIDKIQILQSQDSEMREQNAIFDLYEDTLINGWLKFLLYNDESLINQKIQKDISVLKDRIMTIYKKQFEDIYYQFYQRYFKLLFLKSRRSVIKLMSYMNYFRCLQKNMNLSYVQLIIGQSIEGSQEQKPTDVKYSEFDATIPLYLQQEKITQNKMHDERFALTNPSIANYGNLTQYNEHKSINPTSDDQVKKDEQPSQVKQKPSYGNMSSRKNNENQNQKNKKKDNQEVEEHYEEPHVLYEEEVIELENDIITIRDHNDMKILYDTSVHDFHMILEKIGQICSFYFHFRIKHDISQKDKDKGIFKDTFDREALIDIVLNLESQYYLNKVKLLRNLSIILKNTFYPDLRNQLIGLMSNIMARRPRMNLFENSIFQCYHFEIQNLQYLNEIIEELIGDLESEEEKVYQLKRKLNPYATDRLCIFLNSLKSPGHERTFSYYTSGLTKLIINIEQNRDSFSKLITSCQNETAVLVSETLKCENAYFKELLDVTKKVIYDNDGSNLYLDFMDFRFIEREETLDQPENFDIIQNKVQTYIEERLSNAERDKLSFDAFSMLEFMKTRKKFNNFLFGLSSLLEIYRLQVCRVSDDFRDRFDNSIDTSVSTTAAESSRKNYIKLLLDLDQIKIAKDILILDNWLVPITKKQSLVQLTQYLESLILCSQLTQNYVIINNIYFQSVLNDMNKDFFKKIKCSAPEFFRNIFEKKKQISQETMNYVTSQEPEEEQNNVEDGSGRIFTIKVFCKRLKREVQFQAMKIQTLLQRNAIEKFSKKLPFEQPLFQFTPMSPIKEVTINVTQTKDSMLDAITNAQIDEDLDSKGEVFFDSLGCAVKIFNMPSVEQILNMTHDDFEQVMERYGMNKLPEHSDDDEYFGDEEQKYEKSQTSGGKDWLKAQEKKLEKDICLLLPNKNIQVNKGSTTLKGFRKREFLQHQHLLYLRKTQLFVLWKILGNLLNILSFCTFQCSLEANSMDMLYFANGHLGYDKCKIDVNSGGSEENELQQKSMTNIKSLKDLSQANKKAIPVFKRNELRLRRDIENLKGQLECIEQNIQIIRNNPKIADSNDAIMSYLEKIQNRYFLSVLLLLMQQLNISREKQDYEFMFRLRTLIIDLNFPNMNNLARYEDGKILLAKNLDFHDKSADFIQSPDLKIYDSSSDFMDLIRVIFWDQRPKNEENLHSTIAILNPNRYFFMQFMKFGSVLEKGLIGMPQSRITELSVTKNSLDFTVSNFLRNNFVFEQDDPFKYERMCTKIINLEIYLFRKLNILPFEILPGNKDPLKELQKSIKDKIKIYKDENKNGLSLGLPSKPNEKKQTASGKDQENQQPPEEAIILDLTLNAFSVSQLMYQEAITFYYEENLDMSKWIKVAKKQNAGNSVRNTSQQNKTQQNSSLQVLDILSILSNFTSEVFNDSTEVKTLNKNEALVISKEDLKKNLHGINLDLIDLIEDKYSKSIYNMEEKCEVLENDVIFQKKWNKLLLKKLGFLENNIQNVVDSQVASRSNELIYEIQYLQKKANYTADQRQIDKVRVFKEIKRYFEEQLRENEQVNENTLNRFYDFAQDQKVEAKGMIENIKDQNYKLLKEAISKALEDHGGSNQALHAIDGIWNSTLAERKEEEQKKKQTQPQISQVQQQQQQVQIQAVVSQRLMRTTHTEESGIHHEDENPNLLPSQQMMHITPSQQNVLVNTQQSATQQNIGLINLASSLGNVPNPMQDYNLDSLPVDVYERVEHQNKDIYKLLSSFRLIRAFANMKMACKVDAYERQIQQINENNSSNDQLFRDKKEMQIQTENMKDQLLAMKKTMATMEYQNEILRRDVQRSRKERLKALRTMKNKDDKIRQLEERVEQNLKDRIATYNNIHSMNQISRQQSVQSLRKRQNKTLGNSVQNGGTLNQIDSSFVIQQQNTAGNILPQSILKQQYSSLNQNMNTQMSQSSQLPANQRIISSAHPVLTNSQSQQIAVPDLQNKRPTTALVTSKSTQLFQLKTAQSKQIDQATDGQGSSHLAQINYQTNTNQEQKLKQKPISGLITRPFSNQNTPSNKFITNPKTLSMTYKIKNPNPQNQAN